jgi:hypothetical protein
MHCFFEEEAFDMQGGLRQPKALSINKIGHALHDLDPVFDAFSHGPALAALAADLGLLQPQVWQSQVIFKQPGIGGEVRWHQDASFFVTEPQTVTTFWFALEDATLANGCLWVQPGGHRTPAARTLRARRRPAARCTARRQPWPTPARGRAAGGVGRRTARRGGVLPRPAAALAAPPTGRRGRAWPTRLHVTEVLAVGPTGEPRDAAPRGARCVG